jgi:probable rRNA maturation factor
MLSDYCIAVDNRQTACPVDTSWLSDCLRRVLLMEGVAVVNLQVALVDDAEIQRVNREFLNHDWATDVISFDYAEHFTMRELVDQWPRGSGRWVDGEVLISVETAVRQAALHGWSLDAELLLYGVHGCLHLCGYDDLVDAERLQMRRREREVLQEFGLTPRGLEDEQLLP